jgi:hypothetical protein
MKPDLRPLASIDDWAIETFPDDPDRPEPLILSSGPLPRRYCAWVDCQNHLTEADILKSKGYCSVRCRRAAGHVRTQNRKLSEALHIAKRQILAIEATHAEYERAAQRTIAKLTAESLRFRATLTALRAERRRNILLSARIARAGDSLKEARRDAAAATKASLHAIGELRRLRAELGASYLTALNSRDNS